MITFPSGNSYKLVYLDTNALNYIAKNKFETAKNFLLKFCMSSKYMFVTSAFNLYELSNSKYESRDAIIKFFNVFPLAIIETYPQLVEYEKKIVDSHPNMIMFAIGPKGLFNVQMDTILEYYDNVFFL